ncbi:hypothetical protein C7Y70_15215 [Pseudoalteromonas sp. KS88]|uniref:polysaccharide pyruvyl transferase family protein n=1 Tax=Pseudoalteromonas sp. KS88 TaxID=2109918 RepID=UPI0010817286|nr:polysaccharide pyruvyl transferase family protein [Pseudoalteromonas sp. KS88]TGE79856.1 hypothetical protein C7Y70_15215 [Pseudoalteromonas sp. KS88]
MNEYKCLIRGAYGASNFGDDALLDVIYTKLLSKYSEQDIAIWGSNNVYLSSWYPQSKIIIKKDLYKTQCDTLIYGGGTQFYDFGKGRSSKQLVGLLTNPAYTFNKLVNKLLGKGKKPVEFNRELYLAVGMGPFLPDSVIKKNVLQKMKRSDFVSLRDDKSMAFAEQANVTALKTVDICLSKTLQEGKKDNGRIAVVLRDWEHTESEYTIEHLYDKLKHLDLANVDFITFGKDQKLKQFIKERNLNLYEWDPYKMTIDDFLNVFGRYELIYSSRYHGVIYSVLLGIPVIALPIEPKLVQASLELPGVTLYEPEHDFLYYKDYAQANYDKIVNSLLETKRLKHKESNQTIDKMLANL